VKRPKINKVAVIPALFSLGNFVSGFASITLAIKAARLGITSGDGSFALYLSAMCICFAMVFDLLDGRVARMTGGESAFGVEIDSLSDAVSFGVAPAAMAKVIIDHIGFPGRAGWVLVAGYASFAVMRLARYNSEKDVQPSERFSGLPTPAAAGAVVSLVLLYLECTAYGLKSVCPSWFASGLPKLLPIYMLLLGLLMVSRIRYSHLGRKLLSGRKPFTHIVILSMMVILTAIWLEPTLSIGFTLYVVLGPVFELGRMIVLHFKPHHEETLAEAE
jgi:CDP-diacylglycerol--serine O-phosphatidyltransferase